MKPKFTAPAKTECFVQGAKYATRAWMIDVERADKAFVKKHFAKFVGCTTGTYADGLSSPITSPDTPDFAQVISAKRGHRMAHNGAPVGVQFERDTDGGFGIEAYVFEAEVIGEPVIRVGVAPEYVPLLALGIPHVISPVAPIQVRDNDDNLVAIVMPYRLRKGGA